MSSAVRTRIILLIESELRETGRQMRAYREACAAFKADPTSDEKRDQWSKAFNAALSAAYGALYHLSLPDADDAAAVTVIAVDMPAVPERARITIKEADDE